MRTGQHARPKDADRRPRGDVRWQVVRLRRVVIVVALVLIPLSWVRTFLVPMSDSVREVDVVLVLGPIYNDTRLDVARSVARTSGGTLLMVSVDDPAKDCRDLRAPEGSDLMCFRPEPFTTRGEARAVGQVVRARALTSVAVVSPPDQLRRAVLRVRRCVSGPVLGIASPRPWDEVVGMAPYQNAAMVQAYLQPTC